MDFIQAITLSLVQGLTEFLPISSSAHLILFSKLAGWKDQGVAFDAVVHFGTLTAVVFYYRATLLNNSITNILPTKHHPLLLVGIASIPIFIVAYQFESIITSQLRTPLIIAGSTICFGLLLWLADYVGKKGNPSNTIITVPYALLIGIAQILALIPGTSRAGITLTAGLLLGLSRTHATHFSFLLAIPTIAAAVLYEGLKLSAVPDTDIQLLLVLLLSFALSASVALLTIHFFLALVEKIGMLPFVIYRIVLGSILLVLFG